MKIRCGSCGGDDLSDELEVKAHNGIWAYLPSADDGWLSKGKKVVARGRICFDCGFIGLYAGQADRDELRANRDKYRAAKGG